MSKEYLLGLEPKRQQAVAELTGIIARKYPSASFAVGPGIDDEEATHITAVVDIDDPDEVIDAVIDKLLHLQVGEQIPVSVIPIRTPERVAVLAKAQREKRAGAVLPPTPLL